MLSQLRGIVAAGHRAVHCRIGGHTWTDMAYPPACSQCGRSRALAPPQPAVTEAQPIAA